MRLHHYHESSASYRIRIALALKGIRVDYNFVDIRAGEHLQPDYAILNPQKLVPCLNIGDGVTLGQSVAILEWLEEAYPEPSLYPNGAINRAQARSLVQQIASDAGPFQKTTLQLYLKDQHGFTQEKISTWLNHWLCRAFDPLEHFIENHSANGQYIFGDTPGAVECFLVPQIYNAKKWNVDLSAFPALLALDSACQQHHAFQAAHPNQWR